MLLSLAVYFGMLAAFLGAVCVVKPLRWLRLGTRRRAALALVAGLGLAAMGFLWPLSLTQVAAPVTRLDFFIPAYQVHEVHSIVVHAPAERVDQALRQVTASEISFFHTLTWIRRLGRSGPQSIVNAPENQPILEVATRTSFLMLADEPGHELVLGGLAAAPGALPRKTWTPDDFRALSGPGYGKTAMNFRIEEIAPGECRLTTETRVYLTDAATARAFAVYWRVIYPGSSVLRFTWLRAIRARAERADGAPR